MIQGYRTAYDMGPPVSPLNQPDPVQARAPNASDAKQTSLAPADVGVFNSFPETSRPVPQSSDTAALTANGNDARTPQDAAPDRGTRDLGSSGGSEFTESSLPQLSAQALATALMTAEPDKALVPRVLPTDQMGDAQKP